MLLAYWLERAPNVDSSAKITTNFSFPSPKVAQISWDPETNAITPDTQLPGWVFSSKLVAKPDQLIKRRGKAGLLALNQTWDEAKAWITARAGKPQKASDFFFVRSTSVSAFRVFGDTRPRHYELYDECQPSGSSFSVAISVSSMCHDVPFLGVNMQGWLVRVLGFRREIDVLVALIVHDV